MVTLDGLLKKVLTVNWGVILNGGFFVISLSNKDFEINFRLVLTTVESELFACELVPSTYRATTSHFVSHSKN